MITYNEFIKHVDYKFWNTKPLIRYGQAIMLTLAEYCPSTYKNLSVETYGCFEDDAKSEATLIYLEKNWNTFKE